jgi:FkbM family methyltransferase
MMLDSHSWRAARDTIRFIWTHPLARRNRSAAIGRWVRWQIGARILPGPVVLPFVGPTKLVMERGFTGATGNLYVGLHEFEDMAFVLHFLREDDRFIDVGANVGTYTLLASGVRRAQSVAIEPLPDTFERLRANLRMNDLDQRVRALCTGVGRRPGKLRFTRSLDTMNHVSLHSLEGGEETIEVPVATLDDLASDGAPLLVKVDVEGFETEVFAGACGILANPELRALIVELNGSGARYGFDEAALRQRIESHGFQQYTYEPFERFLERSQAAGGAGNALYLRDVPFVERRVREAPRVRVLGVDL